MSNRNLFFRFFGGKALPAGPREVYVCTNRRDPAAGKPSCNASGTGELLAQLKGKVEAANLPTVRVKQSGCMDHCEHGQTIAVYPEDVWYGFVRVEDLDEIVDKHLRRGRPVERLVLRPDCRNFESCPHRP
jgi:(2Fe-2S) ferredoxin